MHPSLGLRQAVAGCPQEAVAPAVAAVLHTDLATARVVAHAVLEGPLEDVRHL